MAETFYRMESRSTIASRWGDYGDVLYDGMVDHSPRVDGKLTLERTGPYIPPITFPGLSVVFTDAVRNALDSSGLTGFTFLEVEKKQIVELDWQAWDIQADEPAEYPESGEPEDYILARPHSPEAAAAMGKVWELVVPYNVEILRPPVISSYKDLAIDLRSWNGEDVVRGRNYGRLLFSQRAQEWFAKYFGEYVQFDFFRAA